MAVKENGEEGTVGYEEFDSKEFEADKPEAEEKDEETPEKVEDEKEESAAADKLTAQEAFGDDDKKDASEETTEEASATESAEAEDKAAYEPNHKYKVYDEERDFPEPLKALVKDKDSEELVRNLLSKADGLDEMKPRHQQVVAERDDFKSQVDWYKTDINRVLSLRDKAPTLFAAELGLSDDWVIKRAKEIVEAKDSPEAWDSYERRRASEIQSYNTQQQMQRQQAELAQQTNLTLQTQLQTALSHPDVSSFQSQFDKVHGIGAFQEEVRKHGYYHYERTKATGRPENLSAMDAVKAVYEFHKKAFAGAPQDAAKLAETKVTPTRVLSKERPKPIPNVGKGKNVAPTQRRFKNIKEMREYADKYTGD